LLSVEQAREIYEVVLDPRTIEIAE
jgi:hypothetical protein